MHNLRIGLALPIQNLTRSTAVPIVGDGRLAGDVDVLGRRALLPFLDPGALPCQPTQGGNDQVADQVRPLFLAGLVAELNLCRLPRFRALCALPEASRCCNA